MTSLTPNQLTFIEMMTKSEAEEADGFSILSGREDAPKYFDALLAAGLFAPTKNRGPIPADDPRYVSIPYWRGLDYLDAVATHAGRTGDVGLGNKIVSVIVAITKAVAPESEASHNFHTWRKFAEFAAAIPLECLSDQLIQLVPVWLSSRFDSGTVGDAFGRHLIPKLLEAPDGRYHRLALEVVRHITHIVWKADRDERPDSLSPFTALDPYWVREITAKHLDQLAGLLPRETVELFTQRVRDVFQGDRASASWLFRPAIEQHPQNRDFSKTENLVVAGLRDSLLSWVAADSVQALAYVASLYRDKLEILRRVAIYLVNAKYDVLSEIVPAIIDESFLEIGLTHEVYGFLDAHFGELPEEPRRTLIKLVIASAPEEPIDEVARAAIHRKRTWLTAMAGKGVEEIDLAYQDIVRRFGRGSPHPDFLSYMESRWGPGPSGYSKAELLSFLLEGTLVEKLNGFMPGDPWNGPTVSALVDELQLAVTDNPTEFFEVREKMLGADRPYQYGYLHAYMKLWSSSVSQPVNFDWETGWPALLEWMQALVGPDDFWSEAKVEAPTLTPARDWIPPVVADFVRAGANTDEHAFDPDLLPTALGLIARLLDRLTTDPLEPGADPIGHAINQARGRALEALFILSLRSARVADQASRNHAEVWAARLEPLFNAEVRRVPTGNVEFVALFGQFLPQMQYLAPEWTEANTPLLFDVTDSYRLMLATSGLAYAPATKPVYDLLSRSGALDAALRLTSLQREGRERLIERVVHAMLFGDEPFEGPRIEALFEPDRTGDLRIAIEWFWGLRSGALEPAQTELIRRFWRKAVQVSLAAKTPDVNLLADLGRMVCFVDQVGPGDAELVLALAPHADSDHHSGWFYLEELDRLADTAPKVVAEALLAYVRKFQPGFDFEQRLMNPTEKVVAKGFRKEAILISEALQALPEFRDLYKRIM